MNCKTCGYRLWNIASRTCPECGSTFSPSEFDFAPNEVQYVCPGCEQVYYGTSPTGHLVPEQFDCVKCGRHLRMNEMVLRPADWSREDRTGASVNPWLERESRGRVSAFFAMIGWGMARPAELMRATPPDSSLNQAWWYAIVSYLIYSLVGYTPFVVFIAIISAMASPSGGGSNMAGVMTAIFTPLLSIGIGLLLFLAFVLIWGGITHLCLQGAQPASTIRRTFQSLCYTCGPMCVIGVPCLGVYMLWPLALIWWLISGILAVKEAQQVSGGRAAFAVFVWPTIVTVVCIGLIVWMFTALFTSMSQMQGGIGIYAVGYAVIQHAHNDPNGHGPTHVLELTQSQTMLSPDSFVDWTTSTGLTDVQVAGVDLNQFTFAPLNQQQTYIQQAVTAQPANVIAHRLGDYVFTYHGIDINNNPDPGLWLVVFSPDPAVNSPPAPGDMCQVFCADGSTHSFTFSQLPNELAQQNTLRQTLGLPPLPDPQSVTDAQPAVAP